MLINIQNATGGSGNDTIIGNGFNNILDGGIGADSLTGGAGNDTYVVDNAGDVVTDSQGTDTVQSSIDYTLGADVENLTLTGSAFIGTGNDGANVITGSAGINVLFGLGGNDTLDSGGGADAMIGGLGNDTYIVQSGGEGIFENDNEGTDTVMSSAHYRLSANIENLTLQGSADLQAYGNSLANTITGNAGSNILDGDAGADVMSGGAGNDVYFVDNGSDTTTENVGEGNDTVYSTTHLRLSSNVENLILQGSADLQAYGNGSVNAIFGNAGNNILDGDAGVDVMLGGAGNDAYFVDNGGDMVIENASEGNDLVFSTAHLRLSDNVEYLILQGSADLQGYGNNLANIIIGNAGNNILNGDVGVDAMFGGAGNDAYFVDNAGDVAVENPGEGNDVVFSTAHLQLSENVETLVLQGGADLQGYGNSQANTLFGNTGNNLLNGQGGADIMVGGAGNDVYFVDNGGDLVFESLNQGTDAVFSTVNYTLAANVETLVLQGSGDLTGTGNGLANMLYGNTGANTLDGGAGADLLTGGAGNDAFVFHAGEAGGDIVVDFDGQGAGVGHSLSFVGYGSGASFDNVDATHWQITYNGGSSVETITFLNGASIDPQDFLFS